MGNSQNKTQINPGIKDYILEEFQKLQSDPSNNYLLIHELLQANHPDDFPFDFRHLGILFICDQTHDGIFTLKDFEHFALWIQINLSSIQKYQFRAHLQAKTVTKMIEIIEKKDGENLLITWVHDQYTEVFKDADGRVQKEKNPRANLHHHRQHQNHL